MILRINGNISRYYVETLCMVFFPGATFGEKEEPGVGVPEVNVNTYSDINGAQTAFVSIKLNDRVCEATATVSPEEKKSRMKNELRAGVSALIMLVYALLFDVIGYFPSTILFITAYLLLFRVKKPLYYVVCYATMVVIWAAFTYFFQLRLP